MSVLVTGGTGFVGAEVVRQLVATEQHHEIHVGFRQKSFHRIQDLADDVTMHQMDLRDREAIRGVVESVRPSTIFHFGAVLTGPGEQDPESAIQTNAIGTYALLEAAHLAEVEKVVFASSIGTFGADVGAATIRDTTLQRPVTIYGITKLFGELLGLFYFRKYGLDFRGLRFPSVVGPGASTPSITQYTSWAIEAAARGNPFTVAVRPSLSVPILYYKDAARAAIEIARAPRDSLTASMYLVDGVAPTPTAQQLVDAICLRFPSAAIGFEPDADLIATLDEIIRPIDDSPARRDWAWRPAFDLTMIISDFAQEIAGHLNRY